MNSTDSIKTRVEAQLTASLPQPDSRKRAFTLWHDFLAACGEELPDASHELWAASIDALITHDAQDAALRHDVSPEALVPLIARIRSAVDLSPFDPRYTLDSPRVNPMMQQLAGLLFDVCARSHDPLDDTRDLPQIPTTWTLLTLRLPEDRGTLVSLVDNHTKFVLDQRLLDEGALTVKLATDMLVSVMHKSGIRPDDIMIQNAELASELSERLRRVEIAWLPTDGAHLETLTASFLERFSEPEALHTYFAHEPERLPSCMTALHEHMTRFFSLRPWERLGSELMIDISSPEHAWLLSVLDARGGRLGFTLLDASQHEEAGAQHIIALIDCAHIARPTLAALANLRLSPVGKDYFAMIVTTEQDEEVSEQDFALAASLCRALNAFIDADLADTTLEDAELGLLHITLVT